MARLSWDGVRVGVQESAVVIVKDFLADKFRIVSIENKHGVTSCLCSCVIHHLGRLLVSQPVIHITERAQSS
ncbi:hypothetical protein E2C01_036073 [Portunus trituberculatus]|uniref:Uncharacterized protein n=1 Tax=Portunus trituberculatus TaxID=210409 RepID=A0A5B7F5W4_PORTR|nr:hypothetical protein [Portunus trituberculatus]